VNRAWGVGCFGSRGQEQDRAREGLTGRRAMFFLGHRRGLFSSFLFICFFTFSFLNISLVRFVLVSRLWMGWLGLGIVG
jgi:hypothetical protein